jgi:ubiquinol-cytochrome c reductase cytochrome c subunit
MPMTNRIAAALLALAAAAPATAMDGASTYATRCAACHGKSAEGTALGPAIAGKPAPDVRRAIEVGGGREHKPGTKWKMKPIRMDNVDAVARYVAGLKS